MNSCYIQINPSNQALKKALPHHALYETLFGKNLIERFNVYRHEPIHPPPLNNPAKADRLKTELLVTDVKIGNRLNGNRGIVHGGIICLLFDCAMGWARGQIVNAGNPTTICVTANLSVNFRAPLLEGSEAVIRVFHGGKEGRKIRFDAVMESYDGSVVFAEADGLFLDARSKL